LVHWHGQSQHENKPGKISAPAVVCRKVTIFNELPSYYGKWKLLKHVYFPNPFFATVHIITFKYVFGQKLICIREQAFFFWVGKEGGRQMISHLTGSLSV